MSQITLRSPSAIRSESLACPPPILRRRGAAPLLAAAVLCAVASTAGAGTLAGFNDFAPINATPDGSLGTTFNGYYNGDTFQLTADGTGGQATSGFAQTTQSLTSFVAQYTYLGTSSGTPADGVAFVVHNDPRGTAALGGSGGSGGFGGATPITNSVAFFFDPYYTQASNGSHGAFQFATNGSGGLFYIGDTKVNVAGSYPIDVKLSYFGGTLNVAMRDGVTGNVHTFSTAVDIPTVLGTSTGYVGFTGATGGATATQKVYNFAFQSATAAAYAPIKVSGFTQDVIVENGATSVASATTARFDNGNGWALFEKGVNTSNAAAGLPSGGQVTTSAADGQHAFALAPAAGSNALLLNTATTSGTLTLDNPTALTGLSILASTGNGSGSFDVHIMHANGAPDEVITGVAAPDWFFNSGGALLAGGRVKDDGLGGMAFDNVGTTNPRLYQQDLILSDTINPITGIQFTYAGGTGDTYIFGLSGTQVPEPTAAAVLALGGTLLIGRRRRK
jgi:hypothetical protein